MQQATVNLLADMGVQPLDRSGGAHHRLPLNRYGGSDVSDYRAWQRLQRPGEHDDHDFRTATDPGGRIAGVEVSADGGATWHRADGREAWTSHGRPAPRARLRSQPDRRRQR